MKILDLDSPHRCAECECHCQPRVLPFGVGIGSIVFEEGGIALWGWSALVIVPLKGMADANSGVRYSMVFDCRDSAAMIATQFLSASVAHAFMQQPAAQLLGNVMKELGRSHTDRPHGLLPGCP